ncbi:hypothetical protein [Embleya scabrispora]|uniref:hypothetical protein n=1 Tax=Embleya scabrispora TaxID=159449 RepID=UPI00117C227D|nr:hypothetical protein [Embleya scabrispora]
MSRPEGWEWLDEPREHWDIPASLRRPGGSPQSNLVIAMLSCEFLGHETVALAGRFITEYSMLYLRPPDRGLNFHEQSRLGAVITRHTRRTYEAWEGFKAAAENDGPAAEVRRLIQEGRQALALELNSAISAFRQLPGSVL